MIKKILVVDDDEDIATVLRIALQVKGYEVSLAGNGREALECAANDTPDLIVMDVMMPEMDGYEALKRLREDKATSKIPVIMLTAKGEAHDIVESTQTGADIH